MSERREDGVWLLLDRSAFYPTAAGSRTTRGVSAGRRAVQTFAMWKRMRAAYFTGLTATALCRACRCRGDRLAAPV